MRKTESSDTSSRERTGMYVPCVSLPPSSLKNSLGLLSPWRFKIASLSINTQDGSGAVHEQSSAKAYQRLISANQNSSSWQNINTRRCAIYAREQATPARERRENRHLFLRRVRIVGPFSPISLCCKFARGTAAARRRTKRSRYCCGRSRGCLKELKDKELIDEDEYKQMKAVILGKTIVG